MKLARNICHVSEPCSEGFYGLRSEVMVTCVQMCECYIGSGLHFSGVELICLKSTWSMLIQHMVTVNPCL